MKKVLFLCLGNSCRSQMAEGLLKHLAQDRFEVFSAGTNPCFVHAKAIQVMAELGIDISRQRSKSVAEFNKDSFDYVITVCDQARQACPSFPGAQLLHWNIEDPALAQGSTKEVLAKFREVRDILKANIEALITEHNKN